MERTQTVSSTDNKKAAQGYFDALRAGDMGRLGDLFDDDIVWHQPGASRLSRTYRGKDEVFSLFQSFMEASGGTFQIDRVDSIMANGDLVAATLHFRAERGDKRMAMDGVDLMRVDSGRIKEVWLFSADPEAEDAFWGR